MARKHSSSTSNGWHASIQESVSNSSGLSQREFVVVHCFQRWPNESDWAGSDIFRLDANGKIVEHWDVLQRIPGQSANSNSMF